MRFRLFAVLALVCLGLSCSTTSSTEQTEKPEDRAEEESEQFQYDDPGPQTDRDLGEWEQRRAESQSVQARRVWSEDGYFYAAIRVERPDDMMVVWSDIAGERHGVAVGDATESTPATRAAGRGTVAAADETEANGETGENLFVRLVGPEAPGESLEVTLVEEPVVSGDETADRIVRTVEIGGFDEARETEGLAGDFGTMFGDHLQKLRNHRAGAVSSPFYHYAERRVDAKFGAPEDEGGSVSPRRRSRRLGRMMEMYTGLRAVDETLRYNEEMRAGSGEEATIPVDEIEGLETDPLPWEEMIEELDDEPVVERLAGVVPAEMLFIQFQDLRTFRRLVGRFDEFIDPLTQTAARRGGTVPLSRRYQTQLGLESTGLSEHLGHLVADRVAVSTSDPFLREGSDLSIVFDVADRERLEEAFDHYESKIRERFDVEVVDKQIAGRSVRLLRSDDGAVRQHRLELADDLVVVSNSEEAIRRYVEVADRGDEAVADLPDFRYMRALYPAESRTDQGFLFFGEQFVEHALGPRKRILSARRRRARADLVAVNYAALLFGWLEGRTPESGDELVERGYLEPESLVHADGSPIEFSPEKGAKSEWGTVEAMTPLIELELEKVTEEERRAYRRLRDQYQAQWQEVIDPVGVRIRYDEDRLELDGRMVPLPEQSSYDELVRQVGQRSVDGPELGNGAQWTVGVGEDAQLRRQLGAMGRRMAGDDRLNLEWLGDWVTAGFLDRSSLWDGAVRTDTIPGGDSAEEAMAQAESAHTVFELPLYAGAHVKSSVGLSTTLTGVRSFIEGAAPGQFEWREVDQHRDFAIVGIQPARPMEGDPWSEASLYYSIVDDVFVVSLDIGVVKQAIDALQDEQETSGSEPMQGRVQMRPNADSSWMARTMLGMLERQVDAVERDAWAGVAALVRGRPEIADRPEQWNSVASRYLGFEPTHPHGGSWSRDEYGMPVHRLEEGADRQTQWREIPVESSPLTRLLMSLEQLGMGITIFERGEHRGLQTEIVWEPVP